ncbi:RING finger protein 32-like [Tubulanus polymorphus]|uniref:RING finger protein 32-like n=1 Tax=Tubulanus polymorphus TaxID=672921 RepID=UPI003DA4E58A
MEQRSRMSTRNRQAGKQNDHRYSTALAAVALQDHYMKNMALNLNSAQQVRSHSLQSRQKKPTVPVRRPVVDTGLKKHRQKNSNHIEEEPREYVLDKAPPAQTLAQKLGLVESPPSLLSEEDWRIAKLKSNNRDDSKEPCIICKDDFGTGQQVLLSCSHVFHLVCLKAFERFSGKKSCPMCRRQQYETRVIHEGAKHHRDSCATRIQACWRGYRARAWFKEYREKNPPKNPKLRRIYFEGKLETIVDRMVNSFDNDINNFLAEIDQSVASSNRVFNEWEKSSFKITEEQWKCIETSAKDRADSECPICLNLLSKTGLYQNPNLGRYDEAEMKEEATPPEPSKKSYKPGVREVTLLSCSHVFHKTCLNMFEELNVGSVNSCPVCRSNYQKHSLH